MSWEETSIKLFKKMIEENGSRRRNDEQMQTPMKS